MTVLLADLATPKTLAEIKAFILGIFTPATTWGLLDPTARWIEMVARAIDAFLTVPQAQAARAFFLDLATDPGDTGDLSADQTPRPGWLSALGSSWYGVERGGQTYATLTGVVVKNVGASTTLPFKPFDLTLHRTTAGADGGNPTYRNSGDPSVYTGIGGTLTLAPNATATIPVVADQIGSASNLSGSDLAVVTLSFGELAVVSSGVAMGQEREDADAYRARCRIAASALAPGGPGDKYRYAANTARDGSPLQRFDGSGPVGITKSYVSADSATGRVTCYFADNDGPADATDVSSANANITGISIGIITDPLGVLPDTVTILPTTTDSNTGGPGGAAAIATSVTLIGTLKIKSKPGQQTGDALISRVQDAIDTHLATTFAGYPIGGVDQISGAGVLYTVDFEADIRDSGIDSNGKPVLYDVHLTTPAEGGSVAVPLGHVAVRVTLPAITGAANNGSGAVRLHAAGHGLSTSNTVQVYGVKGTTEANGLWTVTNIDSDHVDLIGSAFSNAWVSGGKMSRLAVYIT